MGEDALEAGGGATRAAFRNCAKMARSVCCLCLHLAAGASYSHGEFSLVFRGSVLNTYNRHYSHSFPYFSLCARVPLHTPPPEVLWHSPGGCGGERARARTQKQHASNFLGD